jgi:hypothetical protein
MNWGKPSLQQVLDTALAWAVMNNHFEITRRCGVLSGVALKKDLDDNGRPISRMTRA